MPTIAQDQASPRAAARDRARVRYSVRALAAGPLRRADRPHVGNGLSFGEARRLVEHFGMGRARTMPITGRFIDAAEAAASGVVTQLADPADVARVVDELAAAMMPNAPLTMRAAKQALNRLAAGRRQDAGAIPDLITDCYASADFRDGVASFLAKRPPKFTGR